MRIPADVVANPLLISPVVALVPPHVPRPLVRVASPKEPAYAAVPVLVLGRDASPGAEELGAHVQGRGVLGVGDVLAQKRG